MSTSTGSANSSRYVDFDEYVDLKLQKTRSSIKTTDLLVALAGVAAMFLGYLLAFVVLDQWVIPGGFGVGLRWLLLSLLLAGTIAWLAFKVGLPYVRSVNRLYAAREIERAEPSLKSSLLNLVDLREAGRSIDPAILKSLEKQAAVKLQEVDVGQAIDTRPLMRTAYVLLAVLVAFCLYAFFSPKDISKSIWRGLFPAANVEAPTRTVILNVEPGDLKILAGESVEIIADLGGEIIPDRVFVHFTTADGKFREEPVRLSADSNGQTRFRGRLIGEGGNGLLQDTNYCVIANDARSKEFTISVEQPPSAKFQELLIDYPAYMKMDSVKLSEPQIDAWEGSKISLKARTNMPVKRAEIQFLDDPQQKPTGEAIAMTVSSEGKILEGTWTLGFRSDNTFAKHYQIQCWTSEDKFDPRPTVYSVNIRPDLPPDVALIEPTRDLEAPANAIIPILAQARDPDFELSHINLHIEKSGQPILRESLSDTKQQSALVKHDLHLDRLGLSEGDSIELWVEAVDNKSPRANRKNTPRLTIKIVKPITEKEAQKQFAEDQKKRDQKLADAVQEQNSENRDDTPPMNESPADSKETSSEPRDEQPGERAQREPMPRERNDQTTGQNTSNENASQQNNSSNTSNSDGKNGAGNNQETKKPEKPETSGKTNSESTDQTDSKEGTTSDGSGSQRTSKPMKNSKEPDKSEDQSDSSAKNGNEGASKSSTSETREPKSNKGTESKGKERNSDASDSEKSNGTKAPEKSLSSEGDDDQKALKTIFDKLNKDRQLDPNKKSEAKPADSDASPPQSDSPMPKENEGTGDTTSNEKSTSSKNKSNPNGKLNPDEQTAKGTPSNQDPDSKTKDSPESTGKPSTAAQKPVEKSTSKENTNKTDSASTSKPEPKQNNKDDANTKTTSPTDSTSEQPQSNGLNQAKTTDGKSTSKQPSETKPNDPEDNGNKDNATGNKPEKAENTSENKKEMNSDQQSDSSSQPSKTGEKSKAKPNGSDPDMSAPREQTSDSTDAIKKEANGNEKGVGQPDRAPESNPKKEASNSVTRDPDVAPSKRPGESKKNTNSSTSSPEKQPSEDKGPSVQNRAEKRDGSPDAADEPLKGRGQKDQRAEQPTGGGEGGSSKQDKDGNDGSKQKGPGKDSNNPGNKVAGEETTASSDADKRNGEGEISKNRGTPKPGGDKNSAKSTSSNSSDPSSEGKASDETDSSNGGTSKSKKKSSADPNGKGDKTDAAMNDEAEGTEPNKNAQGSKPQQAKSSEESSDGNSKGKGKEGEGKGSSGKSDKGTGKGSGNGANPGGEGGNGTSNGNLPGQSGPGADTELGNSEEANLEYNRRATELVLKRLQDGLARGDIDPELLDQLGWTESEMQKFAERIGRYLSESKSPDDTPESLARRQQFEEMLKSLDLQKTGSTRTGNSSVSRDINQTESRRTTLPPQYRKAFEQFTRDNSRSKTKARLNSPPSPAGK